MPHTTQPSYDAAPYHPRTLVHIFTVTFCINFLITFFTLLIVLSFLDPAFLFFLISKARQYGQQQSTLSHDFQTWRDKCKTLFEDPALVTILPQPPRDLATLYKNAGLSTAELKTERRIWHPDAWSQVPEPYKAEVNRMVTGVFQIVDAVYVGRQQSWWGRMLKARWNGSKYARSVSSSLFSSWQDGALWWKVSQ